MKKYIIAIILIVLGIGLFTYGFFNFSSDYHVARFYDENQSHPVSTYYYYTETNIILLTTGAVLIVLGVLLRKRKKLDD